MPNVALADLEDLTVLYGVLLGWNSGVAITFLNLVRSEANEMGMAWRNYMNQLPQNHPVHMDWIQHIQPAGN